MTPEPLSPVQIEAIRDRVGANPVWVDHKKMAKALLAEVDRLRAELAEARLAVEEAQDDHDEKENA